MKVLRFIIAAVLIVITLGGCSDEKKGQEKTLTLDQRETKAKQELERVLIELDQIKKEKQAQRSKSNKQESKRKAEQAKKELEEFWNKSAEEGKNSEISKRLDINNR